MTGWLIKVPTERMGGGKPMDDLYAVWEGDAVAALALVERSQFLTPDQVPETLTTLSESTLLGLGLTQGQVGHVVTKS